MNTAPHSSALCCQLRAGSGKAFVLWLLNNAKDSASYWEEVASFWAHHFSLIRSLSADLDFCHHRSWGAEAVTSVEIRTCANHLMHLSLVCHRSLFLTLLLSWFTIAQVLLCIHVMEHKNCRAPFFIPPKLLTAPLTSALNWNCHIWPKEIQCCHLLSCHHHAAFCSAELIPT